MKVRIKLCLAILGIALGMASGSALRAQEGFSDNYEFHFIEVLAPCDLEKKEIAIGHPCSCCVDIVAPDYLDYYDNEYCERRCVGWCPCCGKCIEWEEVYDPCPRDPFDPPYKHWGPPFEPIKPYDPWDDVMDPIYPYDYDDPMDLNMERIYDLCYE